MKEPLWAAKHQARLDPELAIDDGSTAFEANQCSRPCRWGSDGLAQTHVALDDAIEEGVELYRMLADPKTRGCASGGG